MITDAPFNINISAHISIVKIEKFFFSPLLSANGRNAAIIISTDDNISLNVRLSLNHTMPKSDGRRIPPAMDTIVTTETGAFEKANTWHERLMHIISAYTKPAGFDTISTYVYGAMAKSNANSSLPALRALSAIIFVVIILVVVAKNISVRKQEVK